MLEKEERLSEPNQDYQLMFEIMSGKHTTAQIVAFIEGAEKNQPTAEQLSQYLQAIRDTATFRIQANQEKKRVLDIAGTGGDGKHTVNISTLAALVAAATDQVQVYKYGNRSASGVCGSMDVLEKVGVPI